MYTKHRIRTIALLAPVMAAALAACGGSDDPIAERIKRAQGGGEIVIGAAWPWEALGDNIFYGKGMDMAVEELNAAGGVMGRQVKLLRMDDQESLDRGRIIAQELGRNPDVVAVIGHLHSYVTVSAAPIYDLSGLLLVSATSTTPELTRKGYGRVFRTTFNDVDAGKQMAQYAAGRGYRRVVIYYARDEYGRELANAFEEQLMSSGGQVVNRESYDPNLSANPVAAEQTVNGWSSWDFDAVFIAGRAEQAALLVKELRRRDIRVPVLASDAVATPDFLERGGQAVEGTVIATAFHKEAPDPEVQAFNRAFRARYGTDPDVGAALGYDAVRVLAQAMREARSTEPDKVAAAMHALRGFRGVTAAFTFDDAGNMVGMPIRKIVVRDGGFHYLAEPAKAGAAR
ncbi:MAG TPA: penicillin-binding protein activator [Longimicrobium sp.]|jgi:branched-chain amino acid transport system substrate-binding protein|nr:penicillin-binding protein activator [Longimicrobium sp.]